MFRQPAQIHIHVHLRLAGTSMYRRCLLSDEIQVLLTALIRYSGFGESNHFFLSTTWIQYICITLYNIMNTNFLQNYYFPLINPISLSKWIASWWGILRITILYIIWNLGVILARTAKSPPQGRMVSKTSKFAFFARWTPKNSKNQEKMHFFRTFLPKYFAGIEKSYNFALAFQG